LDILKTISEEIKLSPAFLEALSQKFKLEKHSKESILLREGDLCRKLYVIQKGCLRFYYINEEGKDITHWFSFEGDFMTELNSFYSQTPSDFYLETLEECQLLTLNLADIKVLAKDFPEFYMMESMLLRNAALELGEKIKDLQFRDAKTRYLNLIKKQEDILFRVSLGYIASYLGITQQSLSRIRRQR